MDFKQAISILSKMLEERSLSAVEKEAVSTAIGVLDWAALGKNRLKSMAEYRRGKREKSIKWPSGDEGGRGAKE